MRRETEFWHLRLPMRPFLMLTLPVLLLAASIAMAYAQSQSFSGVFGSIVPKNVCQTS